jgi:hypothetical protein
MGEPAGLPAIAQSGSKIPPPPAAASASRPPRAKGFEFTFEREDWTLFRSLSTLSQKAGVPVHLLPRLVLKELADNALDAGGAVRVGKLEDGGWYVEDDGPGIAGDPADIARLFSIRRPLVSSKLLRLPTRGALGNGLRVVVGAVLASGGRLALGTRGQRLHLRPQDNGETLVTFEPCSRTIGTRIEVHLGEGLPGSGALEWARSAADLAGRGEAYRGRSSPHWYDGEAFFDLLQAAGSRSVRELVAELDGCTGAKAGRITRAFKGRACSSLSRAEAIELLEAAQREARLVSPQRLGYVGEVDGWPPFHARGEGTFRWGTIGGPCATIPFIVEAWASADRSAHGNTCTVLVNRTPITGTVSLSRWQRDLTLNGCGLSTTLQAAPGRSGIDLRVNIITPYMPITSDGKAPNLSYCGHVIREVAGMAIRRALRAEPPEPKQKSSQKAVVLAELDSAIAKASGNGAYRFSPRQVFYVIRPLVREALGAELQWGNFETIIGDHELEQGEIAGMYRDARGTLYHPHRQDSIPLGTLQVERYRRPEWTFNKILFIEKEGFFEALKEAAWPERHDCALLTSKGQPTRAARDLLDLLGETGEEILFFAVHDADAAGTLIYQSLQEATRARRERRVRVVNLGLEPEEAVAMGLEVEDVEAGERRKPIASYVPADWQDWLRYRRVELNAMTTPQFIGWLDDKMAAFGNGKLVPPAAVLANDLSGGLEHRLYRQITEQILREARIDERVTAALQEITLPLPEDLLATVDQALAEQPAAYWRTAVERIADEVLAAQGREGGLREHGA